RDLLIEHFDDALVVVELEHERQAAVREVFIRVRAALTGAGETAAAAARTACGPRFRKPSGRSAPQHEQRRRRAVRVALVRYPRRPDRRRRETRRARSAAAAALRRTTHRQGDQRGKGLHFFVPIARTCTSTLPA